LEFLGGGISWSAKSSGFGPPANQRTPAYINLSANKVTTLIKQ
jgi:hypothetical protein